MPAEAVFDHSPITGGHRCNSHARSSRASCAASTTRSTVPTVIRTPALPQTRPTIRVQWPAIREEILASEILVIATPTWVGHMSSVAQRVLGRLDAELSDTDAAGRPAMTGKVAVAAVVGNEDGAHKIVADLFQSLDDIGFTIPAQGCTYWNDQAMGSTDYRDLPADPDAVAETTATLARNTAHLARLLSEQNYPAP